MGLVVVVTLLLGVGCINDLIYPVKAQEGCISHPLPPEVVDKIVAAANIAISQKNQNNYTCKEDSDDTIDGHALATLAFLQHSLSAAKEELSASKMDLENALATLAFLQHSQSAAKEELSASKIDLENVSSTVIELAERTKDFENVSSTVIELAERTKDIENALGSVSSLQSSLSSTQNELAASKRDCNNALGSVSSLQSSLSSTQNELAASKRDCNNGLTEIQSTLAVLRNEFAELRKNYEFVTSKSSKCKDGWFLFQNSCYFFSFAKATWEGGRQQCRNLGADYVKISTDDEFVFIISFVVDHTWVGLNDLQTEGTFKWISDESIYKINGAWWFIGGPDNYGNQEDCVHIYFTGARKLFNDRNCEVSFLYICEMMPETNIV